MSRAAFAIMKIGVYDESTRPGSTVGGSACYAAVLAEALSREHQVELVHHNPVVTVEHLVSVSGTDLSAIKLRCEPIQDFNPASKNPLRRYRQAREWYASLSQPYELFINLVHGLPPFCHAPNGVLVVLFPAFVPDHLLASGAQSKSRSLRQRLESPYHVWEWKRRLNSYQGRVAISEFTRLWTKRRWGIDTTIIYPPTDPHFQTTTKRDKILSVGRFADSGVRKRQREMMRTFQRMQTAREAGWEYLCVGGLGDVAEDHAYFKQVESSANGFAARVEANVARDDLQAMYESAKIFWHAAGYQESDADPMLMEHFGIVTVDAMAAGCVPVVINRGGQAEIVEHGTNGFLWDTLDELRDYSLLLTRDEALREQMAQAARERSRHFSRDAFVKRFSHLLQPMLDDQIKR